MPVVVTDKPSFAAESGHWYKPDGSPAYTVIGANGKERPTTLRDAKKLGLYPSVTTIIKSSAKPGLERWKAEQLLMSALTLQQMPEESEKSWIGRVWQDSIQQAVKAAERGTQIHAAIEKAFRGEDYPAEFKPHVEAACQQLRQFFGHETWEPERSFASALGYGGKIDLHSVTSIVDVKTKDGDLADVRCFDEHYMQTAAYSKAICVESPVCAVLFVSRDIPAAKLVIHDQKETERGWNMFRHLLDYWKAANL